MVSSSGDVIVCRCRRSSAPFIPSQARDPLDKFDRHLPCCDTDLLSTIEGPWSPVLQSLTAQKKALSSSFGDGASSHGGAISTFEWENNGSDSSSKVGKTHVLGKNRVKGGSAKKKSLLPTVTNSGTGEPLTTPLNKEGTTASGKGGGANETHDEMDDGGNEEKKTEAPHEDGGSTYSWESNISEMLLSLPSFDYSHIHNGQNDMVPSSEVPGNEENSGTCGNTNIRSSGTSSTAGGVRRKSTQSLFPTIVESPEDKKNKENGDRYIETVNAHQPFFHGVPLFLSSLSQVQIAKVSAHPLGAHVLMISAEALLFSYGLNHHGQLGIGFKSPTRNADRGFHITPTLITPLLENGGKAINCAAGVDHSLVVVATEGRRLQKLQTQPGVAYSDHGADSLQGPASPAGATFGDRRQHRLDEDPDERFHFSETSVQYHQVYAFGRNNFMKLGLIRPFKVESVSTDVGPASKPPKEDPEDVVLPRRVALHCTVWPQEDNSRDESLPPQGVYDIAASAEHSAALVRRATGDVEVYMWGNSSLGALGLPINIDTKDVRGEIARKPSFKKSNITPVPTVVEKLSHRRNVNPLSPFPIQLSLGPYCSFVVLSNGKCMSCGFSAEGMLGQAYSTIHTMEPREVFLPPDPSSGSKHRIVSVSAGAFHVVALSEDGLAFSWGINSNDRLGLGAFDFSSLAESLPEKNENLVVIEWVPQKIDVTLKTSNASRRGSKENSNQIAFVCAGYDSSMLVSESGQVLSFGKKSGRLGRGELVSNVNTPQPLYGGLHLFHPRSDNDIPVKMVRPRRVNRRALSASNVDIT